MKKIMYIVLAGLMFTACQNTGSNESTDSSSDSTTEESSEKETKIASPRESASGTIDGVEVKVDFGSPAVKGRKVWGGLEEWGEVWRAGANETTAITFSAPVVIGETTVDAGAYGLYIIPNENADWVVILNTDWDREKHGSWGAYNYNAQNDVVRISVSPEMTEDVQERLKYSVSDAGVNFAWEKVRLSFPISAAQE